VDDGVDGSSTVDPAWDGGFRHRKQLVKRRDGLWNGWRDDREDELREGRGGREEREEEKREAGGSGEPAGVVVVTRGVMV